jgi:hypothetical protein
VKAAAARRVAETEALSLYERVRGAGNGKPVDVAGELARLAAEVVEFKAWCADQLESLRAADLAGQDPAAAVRVSLWLSSLDRAYKVLEGICRLGIDARLARLTTQQMAIMNHIIDALVVRLGANPRDPAVRAIVAATIREVAASAGT